MPYSTVLQMEMQNTDVEGMQIQNSGIQHILIHKLSVLYPFFLRQRSWGSYVVDRVCLCVCLSVRRIAAEMISQCH